MVLTPSELKARWYRENKDLTKARVLERRERMKEYIQSLKEGQACAWCGAVPEDPTELDFHHLNPEDKEIKVSRIPYYGWSLARAKSEIDKCILICKQCHGSYHGQKL